MLKRILNLNLNRTPQIESVTLDPCFYKYPTVYKHAELFSEKMTFLN